MSNSTIRLEMNSLPVGINRFFQSSPLFKEVLVLFSEVFGRLVHVELDAKAWLIPHGYVAVPKQRIGQAIYDIIPPIGSAGYS